MARASKLTFVPSADWTGGVHVVDGLPSCEPGWGGGQSEVDTEVSVEVELVVTVVAEELVEVVVVVGVVLGGVEYCKKRVPSRQNVLID